MKYLYLLLLLGISLTSCKKDGKETEEGIAYFGGEVINPSTNYVILLQANSVIDTFTLDSKNRFIYKLKNVSPGLYTFSHGGEIQMVLLEPNDSIMFRLNTMEFDESLVYTGAGAKKNNYLIDLFLNGEHEDQVVLGFSQLSPQIFEEKLDSLKELKLKKLKAFNSKQSPSELFIHLAESSIDIQYNLSKEVYPFVNYGNTERGNFESLPNNFYDYREKINYNDPYLVDYFPYSSFLKHHFENLALAKHFKSSKDSIYSKQSIEYNLVRLQIIDSLMTNENIKNSLLISATLEFISNNKNVDDYDKILNYFLNTSTNAQHKEYANKIVNSLKSLKSGNPLPDIVVFDISNKELNLKTVLGDKPCVIFFWSQSNMMRVQECHNKVDELKQKYPEITFIGINANNDNQDLWKKTLEKYKLNTENEFIFKNPKEAQQSLAIYPINKVIIVDKNGKIENSHSNMFSINFEEELLGVLNQ
ncbi:TlpA family protein disulfide reductase [Bizionia arctica]|uniref:Thioredoxin domain-containing protein n=1 Tax=Bizionia arctica TaxID=1495645 RepID=A0A917GFE2_9FLAO|nr:thioredoxin-like domain-containing protein [Bizionia arctica]GGG43288.1 hypothetical protein GCM10010976_13480 [Bizionia arctica]